MRYSARRIAVVVVLLGTTGVLALAVLSGREGVQPDEHREHVATRAACGSDAPVPATVESRSSPPPITIDSALDYRAIIRTSCGELEVDLLEQSETEAVNNFVFLANHGFYDGLQWHPIIANHSIRTGDPNSRLGVAPDDAGYTIRVTSEPGAYEFGDVAFVEMGDNEIGSQFFIVVHDFPGALTGRPKRLELPGGSATFGKVSLDTLNIPELISRVRARNTTGPEVSSEPRRSVFVESITVFTR